jgi:bacillithiol biosynthesis cysteine-adding enzyme BshC
MAVLPRLYDYGAFREPPSQLFLDYLNERPGAASFFRGGWSLAALAGAAEHTRSVSRPREAVAAALVNQQRRRGSVAAAASAARLGDPRCVAVVGGQQAVLFGGPALVLYKALAVLKLAALLEERTGAPVVPVFWVASDDHDFEEVRAVDVLDAEGGLRTLRYAPAVDPTGQPASRIVLDASIGELALALREALPESPAREEALERVAACYRPGVSLSEAFARLLSSLMPALVVLDPADPALKSLLVPALRREIEEASPTSRLAASVGPALAAAGYHEQVAVREGFLNAFVLVDGERRALALRNGCVEVRGTERRLSVAEALAWLEREPDAFSPSALLRPLVQDAMLPTAAYVGGPAEIAYHAQIGPCYEHFGIPRPALVPRPGATLVEPPQLRALEAEGLSLEELQQDPEALLARWARAAHPGVHEAFARARSAVEHELLDVAQALGRLDPTLQAAAEAAKGRALHQVDGLQEKALRALKKRDRARAERLRRTREALFPGGDPQERRIAFVHWLARRGRPWLELVADRLDPFARAHQVIAL